MPDPFADALGEAQFAETDWDESGSTQQHDPGRGLEAVIEPEQTVMLGEEGTTYLPGGEAVADALKLGRRRAAGRWGRLLERLLGRRDQFPPEERMAAVFALVVGAGAAIGVPANLALKMDTELVILCAVYAPLGFGLYAALRLRRLPSRFIPAAMFLLTASFITHYWLRFDGASGGAPISAFVFAVLPAVVARGWRRLAVLGGFGLLGAVLFALELAWPAAIRHTYLNVAQRKADIAATWLLCFVILGVIVLVLSRAYADLVEQVEQARERTEFLLNNVMPAPVVARLRRGERNIADSIDSVTVIFADLAGFTQAASSRRPGQVLALLNQLFSEFDAICQRHGVERIKTIGDAYMAAAGVPTPRPDHAPAAARAALEMMAFARRNPGLMLGGGLRMGLHSGPVVGGVVGIARFAYDLWGDAVNLASRMESHGVVGKVQVSRDTAELLGGAFELEARGEIEVKGRGPITTYFVLRER
ncbi:MAG: adenylate/guanylate cyclase domain-containing protein [Deltaproteobacteria bacterium]|nr:adenylate/guanylate cyclase domain-containing protein [Deltaproteobacteria bacterium]